MRAYVKIREAILRGRDSVVHMIQDENGVVSFEYLIVAACIIVAVAAAFGTDASSGIGAALASGVTAVTTKFTSVIGA